MNIKVIKKPIPAEICEDGGASVIIIGKETVDLETSIDEAKDVLIVVGDKLLVKGMFVGLFKSMVKGIERDGNARQLGDFITLYPVPTGEFDLDKGWQAGVNGVRIRARLMNELELDISNWEFEDVTPAARRSRSAAWNAATASSASLTSSIPSGSTASRCPVRTKSASTGRSKAPTDTARSLRPR